MGIICRQSLKSMSKPTTHLYLINTSLNGLITIMNWHFCDNLLLIFKLNLK